MAIPSSLIINGYPVFPSFILFIFELIALNSCVIAIMPINSLLRFMGAAVISIGMPVHFELEGPRINIGSLTFAVPCFAAIKYFLSERLRPIRTPSGKSTLIIPFLSVMKNEI
ncbi:MAG: hypothetical protein BWY26_00065 [Elusimicrobia bacterium ADurb.Bin231]|nr:MAG: hypothetical protein BWY26_00065 [Elusimicrobia bacterium ADurb.Bin231]